MAEIQLRPDDRRDASTRQLLDSALRTLEAEAGGITRLPPPSMTGSASASGPGGRTDPRRQGTRHRHRHGQIRPRRPQDRGDAASTGTPSFFVHPGEASHGDLGMITADDVIMALSWSGETAELKDLIDYSRRFRIGLIAVTANADSTLGKAADVALILPQAREACPHNLAPTTSSLMQLALGDALAIALARKPRLHRGRFRAASSGRPARRDAEIRPRHHAQRMPPFRSPRSARRMSDAIVEMSAKGFGCVGVTDRDGRLVGIITDGDLRRHMRPDLLNALRRRGHDARPQRPSGPISLPARRWKSSIPRRSRP